MYTFPMQTLLLSSAFGIFWLILLFALCFVGVHVLRLARIGQSYRKQERTVQKDEPVKEEPKQEAPPATSEPVYYIVERKKRVKSSFGEPKQIRFK